MTKNHIGKTIYFASALPATNDDTGFEALTWVKVSGIQQLPQLGVTHAMIDVPDLQTGLTTGVKGAATGQDTQMSFRRVASDTGQGNIETAALSAEGLGSLKIVRGSGTAQAPATGDPVQYAQGIVHSYMEIQGDGTTHEGFMVSFRQNGLTVDAVNPTVA